MALSDDIRDKALELLAARISLREFAEWFLPATWDVHRDDDAAAAAPLAYEISLLLSEFTGRYRDEIEVRTALAALLLSDDWAGATEVTRLEPREVVLTGTY